MIRDDLEVSEDVAYKCTDDKHVSGLVVMCSFGNNVPVLTIAIIASHYLDRSQVCTKISRKFVNK